MKIKKYILIGLAALTVVSCSEDTMDGINRDPSKPSSGLVPAKLQVADGIVATAFSTSSGAYSWNLSSLTEQEFGCGNNQTAEIELRVVSQTASGATYNNEWNSTYSNINNLRQIISKCSPGGGLMPVKLMYLE